MLEKWINILNKLDFAFQPIIHTYTGKIYGVEALLRNVEIATEYHNIQNLFDCAFEDDLLYQVDLELRKKAIKKLKMLDIENVKLFYNLDNRIIYSKNCPQGQTAKLLEENGLKKDAICFELSEKGSMIEQSALSSMIQKYKKDGYSIAIDDFGIGVSGLKLLYYSEANIIKLDRFFITNIHNDSKKKLFCTSIIDMAHTMGMKVVAEGIEKKEEYYTCKDMGVDFIQGFLVQKPTIKVKQIEPIYKNILKLLKQDRRDENKNNIDSSFIEYIKPININTSLHDLFLYFKNQPHNTFVPIVDNYDHLKGVIYEVDIKKISYSQYGLSLAKNVSYSSNLCKFLKPALCVEATWGIDKTLEIYNMNQDHSRGIFVTKANKYHGFINVNSLLSLSHKRTIEIAKNQNPLTKLPGNNQIEEYIYKSFKQLRNEMGFHMLYFDFNDFKPFNDSYGFRQGDRAILIFSELLQKLLPSDVFIGHIGGDDFFIGFKEYDYETVYEFAHTIQREFESSVANLYNKEDREREFMVCTDRFNIQREFKLLSVACAIVEIGPKTVKKNFDFTLGKIKKVSKKATNPIGVCL
ncbi:GGDEF domain-containing protein [Candidatus Marinarcus aquaticus]|uniref:GGDEF domain-containing protein n=1 Tax=Candidatus Marinarcus aquaticus TaxID=2044504 RepID=A0A4Q0XU20_9BACT|nr:bifunctional diguanylate cyclase/phosphodiesterase [Candidatus Marinarcus aquaticus]RXJ57901.1 GGDEF domain-containing protein [Candidatus Marinarcus aquaticus]